MSLDNLPNRTYPAFGLSNIERALKECFAKRCSKDDLKELRDYFRNNGHLLCIYCGVNTPNRWDHFFPVSKGGDTVKGNLVLACASCDDSKQDRTLDEWFQSRSKRKPSVDRLSEIKAAIDKYQKYYGYIPTEFQNKLSDADKKKVSAIRGKVDELRKEFQNHGLIK